MFSKIRVEYLFKNYIIFLGEGGRSSKEYIGSKGEGGGLGSPKKDFVIFEWSLSGLILIKL